MTNESEAQIIDGGSVRSILEAKVALFQPRCFCPTCNKPMILQWIVREDATGIVMHMRSRQCGAQYDVAFAAGPGWAQRPAEIDGLFGATADPSTVIPEDEFARMFAAGMRRLRGADPAPGPGADPDDVDHWEETVRIDVRHALGAALELGKLAAAAGRAPAADADAAVPWLRAVLADPYRVHAK